MQLLEKPSSAPGPVPHFKTSCWVLLLLVRTRSRCPTFSGPARAQLARAGSCITALAAPRSPRGTAQEALAPHPATLGASR